MQTVRENQRIVSLFARLLLVNTPFIYCSQVETITINVYSKMAHQPSSRVPPVCSQMSASKVEKYIWKKITVIKVRRLSFRIAIVFGHTSPCACSMFLKMEKRHRISSNLDPVLKHSQKYTEWWEFDDRDWFQSIWTSYTMQREPLRIRLNFIPSASFCSSSRST